MREGLKEERTACINRIRGVLAEFGLVFGKSPKVLRAVLADVHRGRQQRARTGRRGWCCSAHSNTGASSTNTCAGATSRSARTCATTRPPGRPRASPASARSAPRRSLASVGDFKQFKKRRAVRRLAGLVPRQNSSGGKTRLGRITKRGDDYLRTLLIQGAKSAVMSADKRDDPISRWLVQLTARVGWQKACVAMANKNARILWAVMTRDAGFDPARQRQAENTAAESAGGARAEPCPA